MDEVIEVKVARTHQDALLPTKGSIHAAGWDLYSLEDTVVTVSYTHLRAHRD